MLTGKRIRKRRESGVKESGRADGFWRKKWKAGINSFRERRAKHQEKIRIRQERRANNVRYQKMIAVLNRYSLLFHILLSCGVCFVIEWISRHSFLEACSFVVDRNLVFLYNSLIVYSSLMLVYLVRKRAVLRTMICAFWLFLGTINGCILAKRVSPFSFTDIKMVGDLFTMQSNYFTATEALLVIILVGLVVAGLIVFWFKGPKFQGKPRRLTGALMLVAVLMMMPGVTDAAVSNNILTSYFENLAQGYKDYGFVYSFSASVLDRGMSAPEDYSEEAVDQVLAKVSGEDSPSEAAVSQSASIGGTETAVSRSASIGGTETAVSQSASIGGTEMAVSENTLADGGAVSQSASVDGTETIVSESASAASQEKEDTKEAASAASLSVWEYTKTASGEELNSSETEEESIPEDVDESEQDYPNIICVLLESFVDPALVNFLETSEDPIPNFHYLYENFTSGYLEVPVVGAGTANTEFEVLTGMGMQFFGLGEYPYKTILKETNCESIASDLHTLGYGTHVVHNNGGNFYSRANAFSMMGFDTFTSKEMMNIRDYTPLGTWPTDDILVGEVEKSLDYTPDSPDFVYTITVESHGDYPTYQVIEDPDIVVTGPEDEGERYAWEYYVNQLHEVDEFIGDLIAMLEERDEKTVVIMFGDHLPTMGLTEEDMATGSLFLTQYVTWNNFGMEKEDKNMTSYQLLADMTDDLDIHNGTMFTFHQNRENFSTEEEYQDAMELLQYDILYGEHYCYGGENPYPASDLRMGTQDVVVCRLMETDQYYYVVGKNFTKWSKIFLDDEKISTEFVSARLLRFKKDKLEEGSHTIVVNQMGSSDTIFRSSNQMWYTKARTEDAE